MAIPSEEARECAKGLFDFEVSQPLWTFPPSMAEAIKHERRRRFKNDIDDVDAPVEFES